MSAKKLPKCTPDSANKTQASATLHQGNNYGGSNPVNVTISSNGHLSAFFGCVVAAQLNVISGPIDKLAVLNSVPRTCVHFRICTHSWENIFHNFLTLKTT